MTAEIEDIAQQVATIVAVKAIVRVLADNEQTAHLVAAMKELALRTSAHAEPELHDLTGSEDLNNAIYAKLELIFR